MEFKPGNLYRLLRDYGAFTVSGDRPVPLSKGDVIMFIKYSMSHIVWLATRKKEKCGIFLTKNNELIESFRMVDYPKNLIEEVKI